MRGSGSSAHSRLPVWAILICLCCWPAHSATPTPSLEYQVKAAFLLNFTKFIEWPAEPGGAFDICIVGDDPFDGVLDQIVAGESYQGRRIVVRRVHRPPPASCQVVFVGKSEKDVGAFLAGLGRGVLTVGDSPDFLTDGGMIGFTLDKGRVRFDIKEPAASMAGLRLSSKLLSVARVVER